MAGAGRAGGRHVLLVVGGGVAAYKAADLARELGRAGARVTTVLTAAAARFVTPELMRALTDRPVHTDLWALEAGQGIGHIALARSADAVLVVPATADLLARMAAGLADDLATTMLLATDKPVLAAPAMNWRMWEHPATRANVATLRARGIVFVAPEAGTMACGETGTGRLAAAGAILAALETALGRADAAPAVLSGVRALVTSGPTQEPIDPVRFLANASSGRQGHAIAAAMAALGADVTLVTGPVALPPPAGLRTVAVRTAREMQAACRDALPVDVAVCAAAVADWRPAAVATDKIKKDDAATPPTLSLVANPDILAGLAAPGPHRPRLVVGFAAETALRSGDLAAKRSRKGCDWLLGNDVRPETGVLGGAANTIRLLDGATEERWPTMAKEAVAARLAARIADALTPAP